MSQRQFTPINNKANQGGGAPPKKKSGHPYEGQRSKYAGGKIRKQQEDKAGGRKPESLYGDMTSQLFEDIDPVQKLNQAARKITAVTLPEKSGHTSKTAAASIPKGDTSHTDGASGDAHKQKNERPGKHQTGKSGVQKSDGIDKNRTGTPASSTHEKIDTHSADNFARNVDADENPEMVPGETDVPEFAVDMYTDLPVYMDVPDDDVPPDDIPEGIDDANIPEIEHDTDSDQAQEPPKGTSQLQDSSDAAPPEDVRKTAKSDANGSAPANDGHPIASSTDAARKDAPANNEPLQKNSPEKSKDGQKESSDGSTEKKRNTDRKQNNSETEWGKNAGNLFGEDKMDHKAPEIIVIYTDYKTDGQTDSDNMSANDRLKWRKKHGEINDEYDTASQKFRQTLRMSVKTMVLDDVDEENVAAVLRMTRSEQDFNLKYMAMFQDALKSKVVSIAKAVTKNYKKLKKLADQIKI